MRSGCSSRVARREEFLGDDLNGASSLCGCATISSMSVPPEVRARMDQLAEGCRLAIERRDAVERLHSDVVETLEAAGHTDPAAVAVGFGLAIETLLEPRTEIPADWPAA